MRESIRMSRFVAWMVLAVAVAVSTANFAPAADWTVRDGQPRKNVVKADLDAQNAGLCKKMRTAKYDKMVVSPFTFYRGTAHLYYRDLDDQSLIGDSDFSRNDAVTWIQGDMHTENYGAFDNDQGEVVFDLNDFDESWVTTYLYDVWRAATSIVLVARQMKDDDGNRLFSDAQAEKFVDTFAEAYLDQMEDFRGNNDENDFRLTKDTANGKLDDFLEDAEDDNSRKKMLDKWTDKADGTRSFKSPEDQPKLGSVKESEYEAIRAAVESYHENLTSPLKGKDAYFTVNDVAARLDAGTGSLGTARYYVLIEGASNDPDDDRILDVKQQGLPAMYEYLSEAEQSNVNSFVNHQGCRVAHGNKALLNDADDHIGCADIFGEEFSIRERSPFKESFDTTILDSTPRLKKLATQWGKALAAAHARADEDYDPSVVPDDLEQVVHELADGQHSEFREETRNIAVHYADQVEIDFGFFKQMRDDGELE